MIPSWSQDVKCRSSSIDGVLECHVLNKTEPHLRLLAFFSFKLDGFVLSAEAVNSRSSSRSLLTVLKNLTGQMVWSNTDSNAIGAMPWNLLSLSSVARQASVTGFSTKGYPPMHRGKPHLSKT
eukprot:5385411-Amphidinium_carterae.1